MKDSGIGRENGIEAYESCMSDSILTGTDHLSSYTDSQSKSTIVNISDPEVTRTADDWFAENAEDKRYG